MAEKKHSDDEIHGLSVVDTAVNDHVDDVCKSEDDAFVVKIEGDADATANHACEEQTTEDSYLEESEEKISLFDVLDEREPEKEDKDNFHSSTLIITTDEHLEQTTCDDTLNTSTETVKNMSTTQSISMDLTTEDSKKTVMKSRSKNEDHCYFWVSNINRHIKATDLKKLFSAMGKVTTAKILTNGKNNFGYVSVDSAETAGKCIKQLNNTLFDGKKIVVSKDRPDLRETKQMVRLESRKKKNERLECKKENKVAESKPTEEKHESKKIKLSEDEEEKNNAIAELKKKMDRLKAEISKYKWKIIEYQRRHDGMRKKCGNLEKELKETQYKMRADRRRLNQDREQFEKNKKMDLIRLEADKAVVNKELGEVKKLREHLKAKIDELKIQPKKNPKRRGSRSPPPTERSRSPRARSPAQRIGSRPGYRSEERLEKKRKRDDQPRGRTPPPPPKLSNGVGKKRNDNPPHRQYFEDIGKRPSPLEHSHGYEYRHKPSFPQPQEVSRPPWQTPYSKDPRRLNSASSAGQSYPGDPIRYGGGYQFPPSSIAVPPRSYYPEFAKPYGHY